jgi:hypothetical protein
MATPETWNEEEAKNELLALTRHLFQREPIEGNADYRAGWHDLYQMFSMILMAQGAGIPVDTWRQAVDQMTRDPA